MRRHFAAERLRPAANFATISSGLYRFLAIAVLLDVVKSDHFMGADQNIKIHYEPGEAPGLPGVRRASRRMRSNTVSFPASILDDLPHAKLGTEWAASPRLQSGRGG
jgi:hypothetical protein